MRNSAPELTGPRVVVVTCQDAMWAITSAQRTANGQIFLEVGYAAAAPVGEVVRMLVDVATAWNPAAFVVGRGEAAVVLPELELAGIEAVVPTQADEAQACGGFLSDALAPNSPPLLAHDGGAGLATAVDNAHKDKLPSGGFIWEVFDPASHAQLMGVTLARWALLKFAGKPKRKPVAARSGAKQHPSTRNDELDAMSMAF